MVRIFTGLYDFFEHRKSILILVFLLCVSVLSYLALQIKIEEDISKLFPNDRRVEKFNYVLQNSKLTDRIAVMVSLKDTSKSPEPDRLTLFADSLITSLETRLDSSTAKISGRINTELALEVYSSISEYLPVFLDDDDYVELDSLTKSNVAIKTLENNYRQLLSPAGIMTKQVIVKDPLGFSFLVLKKLQQLQLDENYVLYDDYVMTKDHKCLLFFIQSDIPGNDTGRNTPFVNTLRDRINVQNEKNTAVEASAFGAAIVGVDNAVQIRKDTFLTISVMLFLLTIFIFGYFRKKRTPLLIMLPVVFGAVFALALLYLIKSSVSILAIACGSVILGIAVNYSLHFLSHLKHTGDVRECIKDLVGPMTLGSATTVLAFLSLQLTNASILRDIGLFAGFSLIGAALCALLFLPHLLSQQLFNKREIKTSIIDKLASYKIESNKFVLLSILIITPLMLYFSVDVSFSRDLRKMNFMQEETRRAESKLEGLNKSSLSAVYVVAEGNDMQSALRENDRVARQLSTMKKDSVAVKFSGLSGFYVSDSLQQQRIKKWETFWSDDKKKSLKATIQSAGKQMGFSSVVLNNFDSLLNKRYSVVDSSMTAVIRKSFYEQFIIEKPGRVSLITLVSATSEKRTQAYTELNKASITAFDRQMVTNLFMEYVHEDFSLIVFITAIIVFVALLLVYGRIELTLITFIPMFITWIWILGIMTLCDIEFNFINVMVSTFIFGLGDDYSIFTMDGMLQEYRYRKKSIESTRVSIILSALTTISGLGVLIFAKHPAMRSIAAISIIGIACVFLMSQVLVPFIFRWLVTDRTQRGLAPMTFSGIVRTTYTYSIFVIGAVILTLIGFVIKAIPFGKKHTKSFYHKLIQLATKATVYSDPLLKKTIVGNSKKAFENPGIIIANHASFLDILLAAMLNPKVILMTNKWVWNSPIFGGVVRLADYFPVSDGAETSISKLKEIVREGYSIVVFPEGTRSKTGKIGRFHKGAFYLAQELGLAITPMLIHGTASAIPKGSFYLNKVPLAVKLLPFISNDDASLGSTYQERTKAIASYFKTQHKYFSREQERGKYFSFMLQSNYIYKGPVLEWYMRVKIRLENYYESFHDLIPHNATVLDLGCGYGFLSYMLHFRSEERVITAVDYDRKKIETAKYCYSKNERINFIHADITTFPLEKYNAIVVADVLHYLKSEEQDDLLKRCFDSLTKEGVLIIRDGDAQLADRHRGTKLSEVFSIRLLGFNKSVNRLNFISSNHMQELADRYGMSMQKMDSTKLTSNVVFIFKKLKNQVQ